MDSVFRVFLDHRRLPNVEAANGSVICSEGRKFIDTTGGGTSYAILGWNHQEVNEAIKSQLSRFGHMDYKIWNDPNVELLADTILNASPSFLKKVYFAGNSGAEACEAAMKMSYQYHYLNGNPQRKWFISRQQSYHGSTADALVLGDRPNLEFYKQMLSPFRVQVSMHHYLKNKYSNESQEEYATRCANELEEKIIEIGPENVAGFVGETIMGGLVGDVPPVGNYWIKISQVCKKYGVHLILDEVYCGTSTTGTYFAIEQDQAQADFVFVGKTLAGGYGALSAVVTTNEIYNKIASSPDRRLQHTTTHQAHSLSVAAALAVQKIASQTSFLVEVKRKGQLFRDLLQEGLRDSNFIVDIRGRGLRFSVEHNFKDQVAFGIEFEKLTKEEYGVLVNAKWHRLCITPPLVINDDEIRQASEAIIETFNTLSKKHENI